MIQPQPAYAQWYWGVGGQKTGPVPLAQLQAMMRAGQLGPQVMVWTEGMPEWVPASTLPILRQVSGTGDAGALNLLLPMGPQSGLAIAAGYIGILGFFLGIFGPIAVILGALALRDIKRNPHKRGKGRAWTGIVLGGLGTVLIIVFMIASRHR